MLGIICKKEEENYQKSKSNIYSKKDLTPRATIGMVGQYSLSPCDELPEHDGRLFWTTPHRPSSATPFITYGDPRKIFTTMLVAVRINMCVVVDEG